MRVRFIPGSLADLSWEGELWTWSKAYKAGGHSPLRPDNIQFWEFAAKRPGVYAAG